MSNYSVSFQVLQTFACEKLPEIGKRYLRADMRIDCDTSRHMAYEVYAGIMICICECNQSGGLSACC